MKLSKDKGLLVKVQYHHAEVNPMIPDLFNLLVEGSKLPAHSHFGTGLWLSEISQLRSRADLSCYSSAWLRFCTRGGAETSPLKADYMFSLTLHIYYIIFYQVRQIFRTTFSQKFFALFQPHIYIIAENLIVFKFRNGVLEKKLNYYTYPNR